MLSVKSVVFTSDTNQTFQVSSNLYKWNRTGKTPLINTSPTVDASNVCGWI